MKLMVGLIKLMYILICTPIILIILIIGFFMPFTIKLEQGWNIKYKLIQFKEEFLGIFEGIFLGISEAFKTSYKDDEK